MYEGLALEMQAAADKLAICSNSITKRDASMFLKECIDAISHLNRDFRDCRNELCQRCGNYKEKYKGACAGCRWS